MKNMKISTKLITSFVIVIMLSVIIAAVGIIGMSQINSADDAMYDGNLLPIEYLGYIRTQYNMQRALTRDLIIYPAEDPSFQSAIDSLAASEQEMDKWIDLYLPTIETDEDRELFTTFVNTYRGDYATVKQSLIEAGKKNDFDGAVVIMKTIGADAQSKISPALTQCMELNSSSGQESVENNTALFNTMTVIAIIVLVISVIVSMILAMYVSNMISKPVGRMKALMEQVGTQGDLDIPADVHDALKRDAQYKDEIAQSIKVFLDLITHISLVAEELGVIANKDLSGHISTLSPRDTLANSLVKMQNNLNEMFSEIMSSTNQVSSGSVQIADGAQLLAQGATEQSATVEELSASVSEISAQTKSNADLANEARDLGESIKQNAEKGNHQMSEMISAVNEISEASQSIGKVIKIIDDIAFQTNILALNAAVEAARAGQHGKGFAVVADEVRSLAAKSAEAAKNTSELIESSIKKSEMGAAISQETAESLRQIVEGILRSSELVSNIAKSSNEQATAISQVSNGIDQVSQVVQQNSATAEESAAASEEMSGQATLLQQMVSQFTLKNASGYSAPAAKVSGMSKPVPVSSSMDTGFSMSSGKY